MTASVVSLSARTAAKGLTAEIEETLRRWDAAGVDWIHDPEGVIFTADHKTEVVMNFGPSANIRVIEHGGCARCPVPCVTCGTHHKAGEMRDVMVYAPGSRRDAAGALVCQECATTGPLAPLFAAIECQAKENAAADPWNAPF